MCTLHGLSRKAVDCSTEEARRRGTGSSFRFNTEGFAAKRVPVPKCREAKTTPTGVHWVNPHSKAPTIEAARLPSASAAVPGIPSTTPSADGTSPAMPGGPRLISGADERRGRPACEGEAAGPRAAPRQRPKAPGAVTHAARGMLPPRSARDVLAASNAPSVRLCPPGFGSRVHRMK